MSGSGLIYGVIVVMWAAVLVPMWLRRHEDADEQFTTAMRVLARRRGGQDHLSDGGDGGIGGPGSTADGAGFGASRVLVRRRRILVVLLGLTAVLSLTGMAGLTGWAVWLVSAAALGAYVVFLRLQVLAGAREYAAPVERPVAEMRPPTRVAAQMTPAADPVPEPTEASWEQDGEPVGSPWEPVRIPPPTYTTKPPAPSPARTIDLSRPGFWAEGWRGASQGEVGQDAEVAPDGAPGAAGGDVDEWHIGPDGQVTRSSNGRSEPDELFDQEAPEHRWAVGD